MKSRSKKKGTGDSPVPFRYSSSTRTIMFPSFSMIRSNSSMGIVTYDYFA